MDRGGLVTTYSAVEVHVPSAMKDGVLVIGRISDGRNGRKYPKRPVSIACAMLGTRKGNLRVEYLFSFCDSSCFASARALRLTGIEGGV
jgi:hypothetical protein